MGNILQINLERPKWEGVVTISTHACVGAVVSRLFLSPVTALQGTVISAISNIGAYILTKVLFDEDQDESLLELYVQVHVLSVPLVACSAVGLGWNFSAFAIIGLSVTNIFASMLGLKVTDFLGGKTWLNDL